MSPGQQPPANWVPVDSEAIAAVRWAHPGRLFVRFQTGKVYVYYDVTPREFWQLVGASSRGRYFNAAIKPFKDFTGPI